MDEKNDVLIVGAGLFGAVVAEALTSAGKSCLVVDKRDHVGRNVYTREVAGIHVHGYGSHIFHTNNELVWNYVNRFCSFRPFVNSPIANYKGEIYNLPFNMNTFNKLWGVVTSAEARKRSKSSSCRPVLQRFPIWKKKPSVWWERICMKS